MKMLLIADDQPDALLDLQCVIQRLIRKHRECRISLMAPQGLHALARRLKGLDDLLMLPEANAPTKLYWIAGRQLEEWQQEFIPFDQALVFTRRWKPALIPWMAGIPRRSGRLGNARFMLINDARWMNTRQHPDRKSQYLTLADDHGEMPDEVLLPQLFADRNNGLSLVKQHYLDKERPAVAFCPGGKLTDPQRWPVERWTSLAAQLIDQGWQVWLIAPATEQSLCEAICMGLDRERQMEIANLSGRLAWDDKIDLMALSRAVLSQETLYSRLTKALNHPLVVIKGAGGLQEYLPTNFDHQSHQLSIQPQENKRQAANALKNRSSQNSAPAQYVNSDRHCQPCQYDTCRHNTGEDTDPCIHDLSVERVRSALLSMVPMQAVD
ncbi:lipopolysaccharide heptosyltransferase II [Oceanospirillum maris]|uniref:lipopolysaccharide heptosyltransferase II n=1 Tax=Oceanospirillum maris TaxID=64977 RepID=UPI000402E799|nr:lipopolysaccharide heptosyltransferase II [Oceanospirillum maris]